MDSSDKKCQARGLFGIIGKAQVFKFEFALVSDEWPLKALVFCPSHKAT